MQDDLLFHIVEQKTWNKNKKGGNYTPVSLEQEGFIHCSTGMQIDDTANRLFKEQRHLFLIIIDANRVVAPIKYETDTKSGKTYPHIYGSLNIDALLDRIKIYPDRDGNFNLEFISN